MTSDGRASPLGRTLTRQPSPSLATDCLATVTRPRNSVWTGLCVRVAICGTNNAIEARAQSDELLAAGDVDAIAAMSDELAFGALESLHEHTKRVPEDVALSGWDDGHRAVANDITSIAQSMRDQGAACARAALTGELSEFQDAWQIVRRGSTHPI